MGVRLAQLRKRVDDDTKDNVQLNALHAYEETNLKCPLDNESLLVVFLE